MMRFAIASGNAPSRPYPTSMRHPPIVLRDDQDRAIVDPLAAELPCLRDANAELLDVLGLRARHDQHGDLAALLCLEIGKLGLDARDRAAGQRSGQIDDSRASSGGTATCAPASAVAEQQGERLPRGGQTRLGRGRRGVRRPSS